MIVPVLYVFSSPIHHQPMSDICIMVIDATEGFTEQDSKIAGYAHEKGKGCIIAINKWDAIEKDHRTMKEFEDKLSVDFSFISYAPFIFISAKTSQRIPLQPFFRVL